MIENIHAIEVERRTNEPCAVYNTGIILDGQRLPCVQNFSIHWAMELGPLPIVELDILCPHETTLEEAAITGKLRLWGDVVIDIGAGELAGYVHYDEGIYLASLNFPANLSFTSVEKHEVKATVEVIEPLDSITINLSEV